MKTAIGLIRGVLGLIFLGATIAVGMNPEIVARVDRFFFPDDASEGGTP